MNSPKRLARIAGVLYLLVAIFGGFAPAYVCPKIYVAGDAAKTAGNLIANSGLVRLGVVADLFQAPVVVFVAITLYQLLRHVTKTVAGTMVVLAAIGVGINCLTAVFEFEGLRVATGAVNLVASGATGSNGLALVLIAIPNTIGSLPSRSFTACGWRRWGISWAFCEVGLPLYGVLRTSQVSLAQVGSPRHAL